MHKRQCVPTGLLNKISIRFCNSWNMLGDKVSFETDFLFQARDLFLMSNQMHIMESDQKTILIKKTHFSPICTLRFSAQEALKSQVDKGGAYIWRRKMA